MRKHSLSPVDHLRLRFYENIILLRGPGPLLKLRIEVVDEPLPTLLPNPTIQELGDFRPLASQLLVFIQQDTILLGCPRTFPLHNFWVQDVLPVLEALQLCAPAHLPGDPLPLFRSMNLHNTAKFLSFL